MTSMKNQSGAAPQSTSRRAVEMVLVFVPLAAAAAFVLPRVGDDPVARQGVIWVACLVALALVYFVLRLQGTNWRHPGLSFDFAGWRRMLVTVGQGVVIFVAATAAIMPGAIVMANIVGIPEGSDFQSYDYLCDNLDILAVAPVGVYISATFGAEVIFCGSLMTRCAEFFGGSKPRWRVAIIISAIEFGLVHFDRGILGVVQTRLWV